MSRRGCAPELTLACGCAPPLRGEAIAKVEKYLVGPTPSRSGSHGAARPCICCRAGSEAPTGCATCAGSRGVTVRIGRRDRPALAARARILEPGSPEDREAKRLVYDKYRVGHGGDPIRWWDTALPVAVDFDNRQAG
jgi:hypothetical protein